MAYCETKYLGTMEYEEASALAFPRGIFGFSEEDCFLLVQRANEYPLVHMQSVRSPDLCFVALPVLTVDSTYGLQLSDPDAALLGLEANPTFGKEALCVAIITMDQVCPTANLLAPVVVNVSTGVAAQCINVAGTYDTQAPLLSTEAAL